MVSKLYSILFLSTTLFICIQAEDMTLQAGDSCLRDEECVSLCCHTQKCTATLKQCAQQRIDLLRKIAQ